MDYNDFIESKQETHANKPVDCLFMPDILFDFQRDLVRFACKKGKFAIWAGCGLGKTIMQLTWSENVYRQTGKPILILAPLGVTAQTKKEGLLIDLNVNICVDGDDVKPGINITNYEKLHKFDCSVFGGVVLDESSILKNYSGKIKQQIIDSFYNTEFKLCCSATPSPNDFTEIGNHAEFLNVCSRVEMLATYFIHDSGATQKWRLKGHAEKLFFKWVSIWAVMIEKPSDIGYSDEKMALPPLNMFEHKIKSEPDEGELFVKHAETLNERRQARRESIIARCELADTIISDPDKKYLLWCDLNDEQSAVKKIFNGYCVSIDGQTQPEKRIDLLSKWENTDTNIIVTKPKIFGMGLNLQFCSDVVYVGLSDSFEAFYQSLRRCYRFGQKNPVNVHIIISEKEGNVLDNIKRKEANAKIMLDKMVQHISVNSLNEIKKTNVISKEIDNFKLPKFMR